MEIDIFQNADVWKNNFLEFAITTCHWFYINNHTLQQYGKFACFDVIYVGLVIVIILVIETLCTQVPVKHTCVYHTEHMQLFYFDIDAKY